MLYILRRLGTKCIILCNTLTYSLDQEAAIALSRPIIPQKGSETKSEAAERIKKESSAKSNALEQVNALISFKEALVNGKFYYSFGRHCFLRTLRH